MGLRAKLFLPLLLAIILIAAYIYALWMPRSLADAESTYRGSVTRHLESVAEGLIPLLLGSQLDAVYGNLDALLTKNADWVSIQLFDPQGRSLYPLHPSGIAKGVETHDLRMLTRDIRYLDLMLGTLEVKVDFTPRLAEIERRSSFLLYLFLGVMLVFLLSAGLVLDRQVRKPIKHLADASGRLAGGNFDMPLPRPGGDEIGTLVASFAGMRDAIRTHTEKLSDANEQLCHEIEERKKAQGALSTAQEELVRQEKLAILGQLSGSVGHELRNPLGVMNNAVYFLKTVLSEGDETVREYLGIIENEIRNSQRIITDLLDFARTGTPQTQAVTARELLDESFGKCALPENVALRTDFPDTLPALRVDPLQTGQVLQNLITNAVQAMPRGGSLRIGAKYVRCALSDVRCFEGNNVERRTSNVAPDTDFVEISVEDSGEGITPENLKKLFQPLFTTKARGIGLGLVVCRNLAEANGGRIEVESELGKGTTFTVVLPAVRSYCSGA
jgi:signal transduction histidine kinase